MARYRQSVMVEPEGRVMLAGLDDLLAQRHPLVSDPYEQHSVQRFPLGTIMEDISTGRRWRYAKNGAGTPNAGTLLQMPVPATDHEDLAIATQATGLSTVTVTNGASTAITANMYAGGLLWICEGAAGYGYAYRIRSHPAAAVNVACVITLYDVTKQILTNGTHKASLAASPYAGLIIHPSPPIAKVIGVTPVTLVASYYFWVQTRGPAAVLTDGTIIIADRVMPSDAVDGSVEAYPANSVDTGGLEECVGHVIFVGDTADMSLVWLTLD